MGKKKVSQIDVAAGLRRLAEERLGAGGESALQAGMGAESLRLFHELQVHQIELEMQNEELRKAREEVEALLEMYTDLYDFAPVSYFTLDREGTIRSVNLAGANLIGINRSRLNGKRFRLFVSDEARPAFADFLGKVFTSLIKEACESELLAEGNSPRIVHIEAVADASGQECRIALIDITERKRLEETLRESQDELLAQNRQLKNLFQQVEHQAHFDGLTCLPNRSLLADRTQQALIRARRNKHQVAVIFVDLDNFKLINDKLGHDFGDDLLRTIAERLTGCVRECDTVARQGGDEFVISIYVTAEEDIVAIIAGKVREAISRPVTIKGHDMTVTGSIGISIFPKDGDDVHTLIKNADVAMYRAKEMGRDNFQFYSEELNARFMAHMTMERHLHSALEKNEFTLHYQPKVSLRSGLITGIEALLRWQNPELGLVSPVGFIPLAEETGLIGQIEEWVLRTACAHNKAWQENGFPPLRVAVNISAYELKQTDLVDIIGRVLRDTGLDPQFLELEISERVVIQNVDKLITTLNELKEMGIHLAMDDFGSGYASLYYLKRFSFDKLKLDCSLVRDITSNPNSCALARAVIAMAHSLHLKVIAEGVESEGQLRFLRDYGCNEMQGYYFSRPVPAAELTELLRSGGCLIFAADDTSCTKKCILVVDDEENTVRALERTLSLDGYRVVTACSAMEGFELLATNQVAVVISDQWMPDMNGNEFLSRVREIHPNTVRILITGQGDLESVTDAINKGAIFKFLAKPWNDDFLRDTVSEAFRHYETLRHIE